MTRATTFRSRCRPARPAISPRKSGNAKVELDSDVEGNTVDNNRKATQTQTNTIIIQQTVGATVDGQTYELTFWYAPRPNDGDDDSSSMKVLWNGQVVHEIVSSASTPAGWQQITVQVTATGPNSVLGFQGAGQANELGAFIDNVSLRSVVVLDDEDTNFNPLNNALPDIGIDGGPGDDGFGTVGTGQILFDAGADGLKQIAFLNGAGQVQVTATNSAGVDAGPLKVVVVDPVTQLPHQETISYQWTPNGSGGGTLTGHSATYGLANPVFTVDVNASVDYTFHLNAPLAHPFTDPDFLNNGQETEFEDNLQLDIAFTVTDGDNDTVSSSIKINVDDDTPDAVDECYSARKATLASVNIVLVIDTSGSMGNGAGSKLELAKQAAINLLNNPDVTFNDIMVVNFSSGASINDEAGSVWTSKADAIAYISGLGSGGTTNYQAAIDTVTGNWGTGPSEATQTLVYFISDGIPNPASSGLDLPAEQAAWENFLATAPIVGGAPGVDVAYAVGIDTEVTDGDLAPIAWAPGNPNLPPVIIENAADLSVALQGSLPGNPSGNVLSNDGYGADGGYIKSVTIEGTTYTYDPATHTISVTGAAPGVGDVINPNGMQVTVMTAIGGRIIFNFDANGLNQAGDWDYLAPASGIDNHGEHRAVHLCPRRRRWRRRFRRAQDQGRAEPGAEHHPWRCRRPDRR